jgi:hypothetical protein
VAAAVLSEPGGLLLAEAGPGPQSGVGALAASGDTGDGTTGDVKRQSSGPAQDKVVPSDIEGVAAPENMTPVFCEPHRTSWPSPPHP